MRSSKSRSRNKNRNNRPSGGNIVNRVFDSQGPDGKVRGTPQQIIDKYNQLHRDSQLNGDRVDAENFAQHAEHYTRMLAEAQREIDAKREEQDRQNRERQAENDRKNAERQAERDRERSDRGEGDQPQPQGGDDQGGGRRKRNRDRDDQQPEAQQPETQQADTAEDGDSGLVETPEARQDAPKPRRRRTSSKSPDSNPAAAE